MSQNLAAEANAAQASATQVAAVPDFPAGERARLAEWEDGGVFAQLRRKNAGGPTFSFIDGPITANNPMGVHHAWGRTYKDIFQRFRAMVGHDQRYQNGFDCQGLWVEVEVEKELGLNSKRAIAAHGVGRFARACRARVEKYASLQAAQSARLGQWMDWPHSYYTMSDRNIEYIWHFLKICHERGWLYRGEQALPWCPRCGTSLSQHEMLDSHKELTHETVYVSARLIGSEGEESLLVWTTTPWTLPANVAVAVHPEVAYVRLRQASGEVVIAAEGVAQGLVERLPGLAGATIAGRFMGSELVGRRYEAFLPGIGAGAEAGLRWVVPWKSVGTDEGTGAVHIAPGCGAEDHELGVRLGLPSPSPLDEEGRFREGWGPFSGLGTKEASRRVTAMLEEKGLLFAKEMIRHRYPTCWRCGEELVFRLESEWFLRADEVREPMKEAAGGVRWIPESAGKRMRDWLDSMGDWCISRKRFWGLPLPFYFCEEGHLTVVGSRAELEERARRLNCGGRESLDAAALPELHRPWIDDVAVACAECGRPARRVSEVGDCWLDAGIVPFSTLGYLEDREYWEKWFPADFVVEMREQIRLWLYAQLFMSVALVGRAPYRTVMVYEKVYDEKGRPMHKSAGNAIWFDDAVEKMGADVMRWLYASQPITSNLRFGYGLAREVKRKFLTLWNVYSFFRMYADADEWKPRPELVRQAVGLGAGGLGAVGWEAAGLVVGDSTGRVRSGSAYPATAAEFLDEWILTRLDEVADGVRSALEAFDAEQATKLLEVFWDDLSTWYVRRSRRRFWRHGADDEKEAGYNTLYLVLVVLARLMAPLTSFFAEELYRRLVVNETGAAGSELPASVHLCPYPGVQSKGDGVDVSGMALLKAMALVRRAASLGHAARQKVGVKVKQPLAEATLYVGVENKHLLADNASAAELLKDEINVKSLCVKVVDTTATLMDEESFDSGDAGEGGESRNSRVTESDGADLALTLSTRLDEVLLTEGWARELARGIQELRKESGFAITDHILVAVGPASETVPKELVEGLNSHAAYLRAETMADRWDWLSESDQSRAHGACFGNVSAEEVVNELLVVGGLKLRVSLARVWA